MVLHHPSAANAVAEPERLAALKLPGVAVLQELLEQAATASAPTTALLLERWRDRPEFGRLAALAAAEPLVADPKQAADELKMAVQKLVEDYGPGRRVNELLKKAEEMGLNTDEKAELTALLQSKSRPGGGN